MYTTINFPTKKALKTAIAEGRNTAGHSHRDAGGPALSEAASVVCKGNRGGWDYHEGELMAKAKRKANGSNNPVQIKLVVVRSTGDTEQYLLAEVPTLFHAAAYRRRLVKVQVPKRIDGLPLKRAA